MGDYDLGGGMAGEQKKRMDVGIWFGIGTVSFARFFFHMVKADWSWQ